ncbi:UDP-N-acetylmuramoyl-L-alanine--D-glutamate ligase [Pueribacillus theae]|uniref:UDP-N-acetylmuramoylalanine--D-glutamate ligase n=1 Tax=Pueribacillus theae TaxID=2171751 RepID=A0A2U1K8E6_9BACI|nr:UDP-N-acetylmuramoyl-L-alanine--D-glutamate ligase [Pueribacillus theae]PWA13408.1 UDP-N-acetylmuramoyl-L-alanine--D-glutamate ligase [Pueribacillus theae]
MKNNNDYKGKKILIIGLAKSGYAAARILDRLGADIVVNDIVPLEENAQAKELKRMGIEVICGSHPLSLLEKDFELIVKNPGIRYDNPLIAEAIERNIPVITEVELAWKISEAELIGITGSNGKTTTTMLITEMLNGGEKKPLAAGNIGTVVSEVAETAEADSIIVTELSSFQLMGTIEFRPKIAVLLNLFDAHLDYHGTKDAYVAAKAKIFRNQTKEDFLVYNADDELVSAIVATSESTCIPFSRKKQLEIGACIKDGEIYFNHEPVISLSNIALPGVHNLENILAAVATAKLVGIDNEWIERVLTTFHGVKHRLEYVETLNGRKFYNDSKATNLLATEKAISAFHEPVILLAGGLDRGNGFDELIPILQKHVKAVVSFGETRKKIQEVAEKAGIQHTKIVSNMEEAVDAAYRISDKGDIILLSPACASWDQYKTFEERGDMFVNSVHKLKV